MEIGLLLPPHEPWGALVRWAGQAAGLGVGSVWVSDAAGPGPFALEPITALAGLARATTDVRLGGFLSVSTRQPALAAKALATVDLLSEGRLVVAFGAGAPEADGPDWAQPVGEALKVVRGAFGGGPFSFEGLHYQVRELRCRPRPLQLPHPPLWVAGDQALLDVAAREGDGWLDSGPAGTVQEHLALAAVLAQACQEAGRDPAEVRRGVRRSFLVGETDADVRRRCERGRSSVPGRAEWGGRLPDLDAGRLVGTPAQVGEQISAWEDAGVATLLLDPVALAWMPENGDDLELLASTLRRRA